MKRMWSKNELKEAVKNTPKDITTLVDKNGNPRFIEGNGIPIVQEGITISYCKWSLSGTHLMLVCAGVVADGTVIDGNARYALFLLPEWVLNKIVPIYGNLIERKNASASYGYTPVVMDTYLDKSSTGVAIFQNDSFTASGDTNFRMSFDLLIDNA